MWNNWSNNTASVSTRPRRSRPLAVEISAVLVVKLIFLWTIWTLWFSHPQAHDMTMPSDKVAEHILANG